MIFRDESIIARAKQVLVVEDNSGSGAKKNFFSRITKYHPDMHGLSRTEQAKVMIEAYKILTGRIKPSDCKLLENDDLAASLLPEGVKTIKLEAKYEDWLKDIFYDFVKPT